MMRMEATGALNEAWSDTVITTLFFLDATVPALVTAAAYGLIVFVVSSRGTDMFIGGHLNSQVTEGKKACKLPVTHNSYTLHTYMYIPYFVPKIYLHKTFV